MDLTFIDDGNPDRTGKSGDLINFYKYRLMHKVLSQVRKFQEIEYIIPENQEISRFLLKCQEETATISDHNLFQASLECEPRNASRHDIL